MRFILKCCNSNPDQSQVKAMERGRWMNRNGDVETWQERWTDGWMDRQTHERTRLDA